MSRTLLSKPRPPRESLVGAGVVALPGLARRGHWVLLALYLLAGTLFALLTPRWQAPDEPAHFNYVQHVATTGRPPVLAPGCYPHAYLGELTSQRFAPSLSVAPLCYEGHQPPLYYYLAAPAYWVGVGLGVEPLYTVRLWSVLIGAGVVLASYRVAREIAPTGPLPLLAAGLVATVPMHLTMLSAANNDGLAELLVALSCWQMLRLIRGPATQRRWLILGVTIGLCLVTKTTAYITVPLAGLTALLVASERSTASLRRVAQALTGCLSVAGLLVLPWLARNSLTYGGLDLLGLGRHDEIVTGQPRTAAWVAERGLDGYLWSYLQTTFQSFWGQFGWMAAPLPPRLYLVLWALTLAGVAGLLLRLWQRRAGLPWRRLALLAAWFGANLAIYLWYNLHFVQFQGRYLFPSLTAIAIMLAAGWLAWLPRRLQGLGVVACVGAFWLLDLWSLFRIVIPHLSPS